MSMEAIQWAKQQRPSTATQRAVLMALADYANKDGLGWPSQKTLAADMLLTDRTIRTALAGLEAAGLIVRISKRNPDGTRGVDRIQLTLTIELREKALARVQRKSLPVARPAEISSKTTGKSFQNHRKSTTEPAEAASAQEPSLGNPHKQNSSEAIASGTAGAAPHALSIKDRLWMDGPLAMQGLGEDTNKSRKMIGRWLRQTSADAGRVLWAIEEAVRAGSGDPIAYVSRILAESPGGVSDAKKQGRANPYFQVAEQEWERQHGTGPDTHGFRPRLVASSGH